MVEAGWLSAAEVAKQLNITLNHLRQLQFRKQLVWKSKQGKAVFYLSDDVIAYADARRAKHEIRQAKSA